MSAPEFIRATPSRERLTFAIEGGPQHWRPIYMAVRDFGVQLAIIEQRAGAFRPPTDKPVLMVVGDDVAVPLGPAGFHRKSLRHFIGRCHAVVVVSCEPLVPLYAMAASCAAGWRRDTLLIESQPRWEQDWIDLVKASNPAAKLVVGAVRPETEARH